MWLSHKRGRAQTHGRRDGVGPSSGWFGDRQRACPAGYRGETDAAEPEQAETGSADQATNEYVGLSRRALVLASGGERASTHIRTGTEADTARKEYDLNLSHQSHEGSSCPIECEQQLGPGLGQKPCGLQDRRLYISAPRFPLRERDGTDEAPQSNEIKAKPAVLCAAGISPAPRTSCWCECRHRVGGGKEPLSAKCTHPRQNPRVVFGDAAGASCATRLHPT